jgi:glycosyltransferase involved in cell wall biosynthesis
MLEALACGRPVLATAVGGVSDWIVAGENGFVCDETDVAALTSTLRRAWSLRATWPQLGIGAARTAARLDPNPECALLAALPS